MGEKSIQKKEYIVDKARDVFARKGFRAVTMKDVVEECDISRGGLYLYFNSTRELFEAVLEKEADKQDETVTQELKEAKTASDVMAVFLKEQKKELLRKKDSLAIATYEFYFESQGPKKDNRIKKQFDDEVKVLEYTIKGGVENGEFNADDPKAMARSIAMVLEGMRITACSMGITEEMINSQFLMIMKNLIKEG
ncbi:MAG: TetR/AcrR family transcriptional regulator [Lachnospiraceae bacterium]|nr:TetR/AcrR family transcriptional regulator [Candidatus Merdinaster equi]